MKKIAFIVICATAITVIIVAVRLMGTGKTDNGHYHEIAQMDASVPTDSSAPNASIFEINTNTAVTPAKSPVSEEDVILIDSVETYERVSRYGKLAPCLRGTEIDGGIFVDADGRLIITHEMKLLFEYFLSAMHEEGLDTAVARIEEYIRITLPETAEKEALAIFHGYMAYRNNLKRIQPSTAFRGSMADSLAEIRTAVMEREELRRDHLQPEVVEAFFALEEKFDHYHLDRLQIEYNDGLNEAEKREMIRPLTERLPEGIREIYIRRDDEAALKRKISELKEQDGSEEAIYELREIFYGREAAQRLSERDKKRADFSRRFDTYYADRQQILDAPDLLESEKSEKIFLLKQETFSRSERIKVDIYETVNDEKKTNASP